MKKSTYIVGGLLMILLGSYWLLKVVGVIPPDFTLFFPGWWTLFLIVPGLVGLFTSRDKTLPLIAILVGTALLLASLGVITWTQLWQLILPAIVIVLGFYLLVSGLMRKRTVKTGTPIEPQDEISVSFGTRTADFAGQEVSEIAVSAVFGSAVIDLTGALIAPEAVVHVSVTFGSVQLRVPENVRVRTHILPIFGYAGNRAVKSENGEAPCLHVDGSILFGSVKIDE